MAFNGFPASYQNPYMIPQQYTFTPQAPAQQQASGGIIWVSGEAGAKAYLVAPNTTVQLWDSEAQTIYLKSTDASGMPSIKVLDYSIRETGQNGIQRASAQQIDKSITYATKAEIDGILAKIEALRADVDKMKEAEHE